MNRTWARTFLGLCLLLSLFLLVWPIFDPGGLREWVALTREEQHLQKQIQTTRSTMLQYQQKIEGLERDLSLIERLVRERLVYARPNELVILLVEPTEKPQQTPLPEETDEATGTQRGDPRDDRDPTPRTPFDP